MKSALVRISRSLLLLPFLVATVSLVAPTAASAATNASCPDPNNISTGVQGGANCAAPTSAGAQNNLFGADGVFVTVTNILIFIIGAIAVIMLIVGGIRYALSQGDQGAITAAKNTILYAIIGIVVAMLAFGAVNFITTQLTK